MAAGGGGRVVEGEVTSVAENEVAPVANINFYKELI